MEGVSIHLLSLVNWWRVLYAKHHKRLSYLLAIALERHIFWIVLDQCRLSLLMQAASSFSRKLSFLLLVQVLGKMMAHWGGGGCHYWGGCCLGQRPFVMDPLILGDINPKVGTKDHEKLLHVAPSDLGHRPTHYGHEAFSSPRQGLESSQIKNLTLNSMLSILTKLHMITWAKSRTSWKFAMKFILYGWIWTKVYILDKSVQ